VWLLGLSTGLARAWPAWAARTEPLRRAVGPWLMGHLSDAALAVATAAFVAEAQAPASRVARAAWHAAGVGVLVGLEVAQGPLGLGTTDVVDILLIFMGYGAVVLATERASARGRDRVGRPP
jgi:hypothetical protein